MNAQASDRFLATLEKTGNVSAACRKAGISRTLAYEERAENAAFKRAWKEALAVAGDALEAEARRRAVTGTLKPVFYRGEQCGSVREYSDTLLVLLLKAAKPKKYRENQHVDHGGTVGIVPITEIIVERPESADAEEPV